MLSPTWQFNPSLSIVDSPKEKILTIGHMPPNLLQIKEGYAQIKATLQSLKAKSTFTEQEALKTISKNFPKSQDVFEDLKNINALVPIVNSRCRYSRHKLYFQMARAAQNTQENLNQKTVLLIGVGGIGSSCATLLAAAGVGRLILADSDYLELSNLSRSTLFEANDLGYPKVEVARHRLQRRNPHVAVEVSKRALNESSFEHYRELFMRSDVVILSGDSGAEIHELAYELSKQTNVPIMNAGYIENWGVVGPLTVGSNSKRDAEIKAHLRMLPETKQINPDYQAASFGPLNAMVSSIAVNEVIRFLSGLKPKSLNRRLLIDSFTYTQKWEKWL